MAEIGNGPPSIDCRIAAASPASPRHVATTTNAPAVAASDWSSEIWASIALIRSKVASHSSNRPAIASQGSSRLSITSSP